jgi:ABC-type molybdate transport system substrate-binding protein
VRARVARSVTSTILWAFAVAAAVLLGAAGPAASADESSGGAEARGVEIGVAYGTEKRSWLEWAAKQFGESQEGQGIRVNLLPFGSMEAARAILGGDEKIHVWAPASSLYRDAFLRDWEAKHPGRAIVKEEQLAFTPMVIVMWKSRYEAYAARCPEVSLRTITFAMHAKTGWGRIAERPEWGHFKFGHTHPMQSNSGLMTLIVLAYEFHRKTAELAGSDIMSAVFLEHLERFQSGVTGLSNSTGNMMEEMLTKGPSSYDALMVYEAVAIDFFKKAEGRWEDLQIIYPEYNLWNDNPYYVLHVPWSSPAQEKAAETFLKFLMSQPAQAKALEHGFRPGNPAVPIRGPASPFGRYAGSGLKVEIPDVCEVPGPQVIEGLLQAWTRKAVPR